MLETALSSEVSGEVAAVAQMALAAGELALSLWDTASVERKPDGSPVTSADLRVEEFLREELGRAFPGDRMGGEEGGISEGGWDGRLWLLDPIDGTNNYVHHLPFWGVSVALVEDGVPRQGVLHVPVLQRTYAGERGQGAWLNGERLAPPDRASTDRNDLFGVASDAHLRYFIELPTKMRATGMAAINLAYVADGTFVGALEENWKVWDLPAAILLAREAGALVTDMAGRPFESFANLTMDRPGPAVLVAVPGLHQRLLRSITRRRMLRR
jgi:fructose-1,6-bisphosphatase/inositol monophosphatase family enzyme